ncbi:unnamed protein product [Auanema sp. JU1783]|nr:unnamed protein product [Auanema sp. JU1783]
MSKIFLIVVLASFAAAPTGAVTYCNTVDVNLVRKCYQNYMDSFYITMNETLPAYSYYANVRSNLIKSKGLYEQNLVCQYVLTLLNCLDPSFECIGQYTFLAIGASNNTDAVDYWADLLTNQYQCTVGKPLKTSNFYCYESCRDSRKDDIKTCHANLGKNIAKGMDVCTALEENALCQTDIQNQCCGRNAGVLACNSEVSAVRASNNVCSAMGKMFCPEPQ